MPPSPRLPAETTRAEEPALPSRTPVRVLTAVAAAVAIAEGAHLWRLFLLHRGLPLWDMAGHGWLGAELLRDLTAGDPFRFLFDLAAQDKWPFGYSLALVPFLAAGGATPASAVLLSVVLWAAVAPLLVLVGRRVDRGWRGLAAGSLAAALWLVSPLPRVLATVVLRETGSAAVLLAAFALVLRARRTETLRAWRCAGLATLAVMLVKWSYGAMWILFLAVDELRRRAPEDRRRLIGGALSALALWWEKSPAARALAVGLAGVLLGAALGLNPGVLVWLILAGAAVRTAMHLRRAGTAPLRAWADGLPVRARAALETLGLPLAIWWLLPWPIHPKAVFHFLRSAEGGRPRAVTDLLFYGRELPAELVPAAALGWAVWGLVGVALLLAVAARDRPEADPRRFLLLWTVAAVSLTSIHPHKEIRYLLPIVPFVFLAASFGLADLLGGVRPPPGRRRRAAARMRAGATTVAMAAAVIGVLASGPWGAGRQVADARWLRQYERHAGDRRLTAALDGIAAAARPARRLGVVGVFDELSADLVRWDLFQRQGRWAPPVIELPRRYRSEMGTAAAVPRRAWLRSWLAEEELDRIVVLELDPSSPFARRDDYRLHNAWQRSAAAELLATLPRVAPPRRLPELGVTVWALRPPSPALE